MPVSYDPARLPAMLEDRDAYQERLQLIVPATVTGVTHTANPAAAATVFVMMYVGAIDGVNPVRPTTITWMSDPLARHRDPETRLGYYRAAARSERAVDELAAEDRGEVWYANNSREPVRDESLRALVENGAVLVDVEVPTNSSRGRYTLTPEFAHLFDPELQGDELRDAIAEWQETHLTPVGRARAQHRLTSGRSEAGVAVRLPGGRTRQLHPGESSAILRGVIEECAPLLLSEPVVVFISESGEPVSVVDGAALDHLGLSLEQQTLLPDCLLFDLDPSRGEVWFIEVVASDGPLTDSRKADLLAWAEANGLRRDRCCFLTAFASRTASTSKRDLPRLASGSFAWFADEPGHILSWDEL